MGPFSFTDAAVRWLDETGRTRREFTFKTLTGQSPFQQAVQLTCEAAWDGRPFSGELTTGPLVDLLTDQPQWPVAGTITYSNSVVQGAGFIGDDGTLVFDISGQSPSLQEIVSIVGFDLPPLGPCSLTGRVTVAKGAFKVEAMQGRLGSGAVKVEVSRQKQVDGRSLLRCHAL